MSNLGVEEWRRAEIQWDFDSCLAMSQILIFFPRETCFLFPRTSSERRSVWLPDWRRLQPTAPSKNAHQAPGPSREGDHCLEASAVSRPGLAMSRVRTLASPQPTSKAGFDNIDVSHQAPRPARCPRRARPLILMAPLRKIEPIPLPARFHWKHRRGNGASWRSFRSA